MLQTQTPKGRVRTTGTRVGYGVAAAVNLVMLVIVNSLTGWGWLPFLTEDFSRVLPLLNLSIGATVVANLLYMVDDRPSFKSLAQIGLGVLSLMVLSRMWQVFPFDFSPTGAFDWEWLTRAVLVMAMVGTAVGMLVELTKLLTAHD